jgi:hypothetical protein
MTIIVASNGPSRRASDGSGVVLPKPFKVSYKVNDCLAFDSRIMTSARVAILSAWFLAIGCFTFTLWANIKPDGMPVALSALFHIALIIAVPVMLICGFILGRKSTKWWFLPAIICFVSLFTLWLTLPIARSFNDWQFKKQLSEYEATVNQVSVRAGLSEIGFTEIKLSEVTAPVGVIAIRASRCKDEAIVVEFLRSAGGRVHQGYVFRGCENAIVYGADRSQGRYDLRHLVGRWYHFSD